MRIVEINPNETILKRVIKEAPETHYVSIYNPPFQQTIGFLDRQEALERAKSLIPLIDSTRNGIKINRAETEISTGRS